MNKKHCPEFYLILTTIVNILVHILFFLWHCFIIPLYQYCLILLLVPSYAIFSSCGGIPYKRHESHTTERTRDMFLKLLPNFLL